MVRSNILKNRLTGIFYFLYDAFEPLYSLLLAISCEQSADQLLHHMMEDYKNLKNGGYYSMNNLDEYSKYVRKSDIQMQFWDACKKVM